MGKSWRKGLVVAEPRSHLGREQAKPVAREVRIKVIRCSRKTYLGVHGKRMKFPERKPRVLVVTSPSPQTIHL
jgi:hypothetical protein